MLSRSEELALCRKALERTSEGTGQVLAIAGDPGIGKTWLLAETARAARGQGLRVIGSRANAAARSVQFGLLAEALDALADPAGPPWRPDSERVVPGSGTPAPGSGTEKAAGAPVGPAVAAYDRRDLHRSVRTLLEGPVTRPGLALLLDDVHAADDTSLDLLTQLVHRPPHAPLLLVLAYRPRQVCRRLAAALDTARTAGGEPYVTRLQLGALSPGQTARLIGDAVSAQRRERLARDSGNNPFYLGALSAMSDADLAAMAAAPALIDAGAIPHGVRASLLAELDVLSEPERLVAAAAAVTGTVAGTGVLAHVTGLPEPSVAAALDVLVSFDLLRPEAGTLRFRHPLLAGSVYHSTGHAWRQASHRRAAEHLEQDGVPCSLRALHLACSAQHGDRAAAEVLVRAARAEDPPSSELTVHFLRAALRLVPDGTEATGDLRFELARALGRAGRLAESRELLQPLLARRGSLSSEFRTGLVEFSATVGRLLGRLQEAAALVESELECFDDIDAPAAVPLRIELACIELVRGRGPQITPSLAGIRRRARECGDTAVEIRASAALGLGAVLSGDTAAALQLCDRVCWLADSLPDGRLTDLLDAVIQLSCTELFLDRYPDAVRHLGRGLHIARRAGRAHLLPSLHLAACQANSRLGRLDLALSHGRHAEEHAALVGDRTAARVALALRALPVLHREGPPAAERLAERALADTAVPPSWWRGVALGTLAEARLRRGDPEGCLDVLAGGGAEDVLETVDAAARPRGLLLLTEAEIARDEPARAAVLADRARDAAALLGLPSALSQAHQARAAVLLATGEPDAAVAACEEAVGISVAAGSGLDEAQARRRAALALSRCGQIRRAYEELGIAKNLLRSQGATWSVAAVTQEQRCLGSRQPRPAGRGRRTGSAFDLLSARERQIVELVGEGMTNRQIGEQLYLSPRTVESHLTRVFAKFGVSTRVGLVGRLGHGPR
ncbi:AAA family ATPase [Kitasatospora sp. NPDC049258]|uniref:helix-turn-helix transcriptional regulator n=1 Tax=Kitasatospora sp. NPDC049258 TaxID=3155394 RepID=UPI00344AA8CB